jgi:D-alanine-D-alanine ligase
MIKRNKHIEIACSTENELSSMSQKSRDAILDVLSQHYTKVCITIINNVLDLEALVARKPDIVFLGLKFIPLDPSLGFQDSNKIWISEYLDEYGIAYTGSNRMAHELELDKTLAKRRVQSSGLATSPFFVIKRGQPLAQEDVFLAYPLFVKPTDRGGGLGIDSDSVVNNFEELCAKATSLATELRSDSLVEKYLPGREFSVAILKDEHSTAFSVMPIELVAPLDERGARILSKQVKSSDTEHFMEIIDEDIKTAVAALAMDVFYALGAQDYGRVDIRLDAAGAPQFLEANLIPSLIKGYGNFPKACMLHMQLDYDAMILHIVRLALTRSAGVERVPLVFDVASDMLFPEIVLAA